MNRRGGFTLIELTAVLLIMALLSMVVGLSLASVGKQATLRDTVSVLTDLDRSMRVECVDYDRTGVLRFDLEGNRVVLSIQRDGEAVDVQAHALPVGTRFEWVRLADGKITPQRSTSVLVPCDDRGQTPTYAYAISTDNPQHTEPQVRVVAGLTGQVQEMKNESQVTDLYIMLSSDDAG